jgi:hypothetical protein
VNSQVFFDPLPSTYRTVSDTSGCPGGFSGKFTFTALLTNKSTSAAMPGITVRVVTLTNGNALLDPQTNAVLGGNGAAMEVPKTGQYSDGLLSPGERVEVPFVLCLKTRNPFQFIVDVEGIVTELVSINRQGTDSGNDYSFQFPRRPASDNGRFIVFTSSASDVVAGDTNGWYDIFLRDLQTNTMTLVSVNRFGTNGGNGSSDASTISRSGRFVVFHSFASDLVPNDTNGVDDIFVRDLTTGTTSLVSVSRFGTNGGNGSSGNTSSYSISTDGRFVLFQSNASDLVENDNNQASDWFVRDRQRGVTVLVSINRFGTGSGNKESGGPATFAEISANGRFVVFMSDASDLVPNDTNAAPDVFVRDLTAGTTSLVSINRFGTASGNGESYIRARCVISADGRFVVFGSSATDLVATPNSRSVFLRDLVAGTTALISINKFGTGSPGAGPCISANGRFVAFQSYAVDIVNTPTNGSGDVYVRDVLTATTTLVSINQFGNNGGNGGSNFGSGEPVLSNEGRYVAFLSSASDLVSIPANGHLNAFVRDLQTGTTTLMSVNRAGTAGGNHDSVLADISGDGRVVIFTGAAGDLVATDTHRQHPSAIDPVGDYDVFVRPVP